MIAKIVQGRGFRGVVNYVLDKDNAQLLYAEGVRTKDKDSIIQSFVTQSKMNPKIARPVAHISLDFSAQDKTKLTDKFMVGVAQEYLKKMGYEKSRTWFYPALSGDVPLRSLCLKRCKDRISLSVPYRPLCFVAFHSGR